MADAHASEACTLTGVEVQILFRAPRKLQSVAHTSEAPTLTGTEVQILFRAPQKLQAEEHFLFSSTHSLLTMRSYLRNTCFRVRS